MTRAPHEQDRRRTQVLVTASGREEVLQRLMPMFRALRELDESFDASESLTRIHPERPERVTKVPRLDA